MHPPPRERPVRREHPGFPPPQVRLEQLAFRDPLSFRVLPPPQGDLLRQALLDRNPAQEAARISWAMPLEPKSSHACRL